MSVLRYWQAVKEDEAWKADALCQEHPNAPWFPERGEPTREARSICVECSVRAECLDYALDNGIKHGIWGGLSERQRRSERRRRGQLRRLNEGRQLPHDA